MAKRLCEECDGIRVVSGPIYIFGFRRCWFVELFARIDGSCVSRMPIDPISPFLFALDLFASFPASDLQSFFVTFAVTIFQVAICPNDHGRFLYLRRDGLSKQIELPISRVEVWVSIVRPIFWLFLFHRRWVCELFSGSFSS